MTDFEGLVSVVVPVYNVEDYLPLCLKSISGQSYEKLDIILVDDGSIDGSGSICDAFVLTDSRARVIHQDHQGVWTARNLGLAESKGEYVFFPDSDDYFHKDFIRLMYEAINYGGVEYPLAICDYLKVKGFEVDAQSDSQLDTHPSFEVLNHVTLLNNITKFPSCGATLWGTNWNKLYRKSALTEPFQKAYLRCQDYESNLRFFFNIDKAVYVKKVLYYWVQWSGQSTRAIDDGRIRNECRSRIFYDHFQTVLGHHSYYRSFLLVNLYRRLIIWKDSVRGTSDFRTVSEKIRGFEKNTLFSFLTCGLLPPHRRVRWVLSLHAPSILRLLGKEIYYEKA